MNVDPNQARAWTLPSNLYTDPTVLAEEKDKIFARTWQVVGHIRQLANPGDYLTTELVGEPLLVVRDNAGELRAFYNVCRHRAGPPAEGCGSRKVFRCGYHGWTYSLEGKLLNAPEMEGTENFRHEEIGLVPIRVEEWSGLVFVNLDDRCPSLAHTLGELPQQAARFGFDRMQLFYRRDYLMDCNWKTYIDNFLEGYHLPSVHPGLNRELDYGNYLTETCAGYSRQLSPIRGAENAADGPRRYQQQSGSDVAEYFWVFPNWMLNCYPDNVSLNIVLPLGPEKCVAKFEWCFPEETFVTGLPQQTVEFSDSVQMEDGHICEVVQKNLRSRSYHRGRYSAKQEKCLHHFHTLYAQMMETPVVNRQRAAK
ncbi:MAG: aromatic ring-hydroxylating dioxygenase subunit alpha [Acidobacteriia bacterium]|nr:aromatic ring-hydroxylating dioxygenase subunit alpha [Terriglobia bacterium]